MTFVLDIPALLQPFDVDSRCGKDLRSDDDPNNAYRRIRDARNEAREEERQSDIARETASQTIRLWREVWESGQEYLKNYAKDLEIVAYMIEGSVRLSGFGGLAGSLRLTTELLKSFWGELLPTPDEEGIETTLRPISRLNGDVIVYPLMRVPMTEDTTLGTMVVWQYGQAKQLETLSGDEQERRVSSGAVTLPQFNRAVAESSDEFYLNLCSQIQDAREAVLELSAVLHERVNEATAPNFSKFQKAIDDAESVLTQVAGNRIARNDAPIAVVAAGSSGVAVSAVPGQIGNRSAAFDLLETVAKWFEIHEPQSILPSEIRKAIRRGKMSPQELYMDLITDPDVRRQLYKDVGMPMPQND
ncbi:MAG: type VI secretion system protein TssA [Planctomycetota bacterium]